MRTFSALVALLPLLGQAWASPACKAPGAGAFASSQPSVQNSSPSPSPSPSVNVSSSSSAVAIASASGEPSASAVASADVDPSAAGSAPVPAGDSSAVSSTSLGVNQLATGVGSSAPGSAVPTTTALGSDSPSIAASATTAESVSPGTGSLVSGTGDGASAASSGSAMSPAPAPSASASASASASSTGNTTQSASQGSGSGVFLTDASSLSNCKCGYRISSLGNTYLPLSYSFSFSSEADGVLSPTRDLSDKGWVVNHDQDAGGSDPSTGGQCWGSYENLKIDGGDLVLTVPGGQKVGPEMKCAEIAHNETVTGGVFQTTAMLSGVSGVCEAFDAHVLYEYTKASGSDSDAFNLSSFRSLTWLQDQGGKISTTRYVNGQVSTTPSGNEATHPMIMTINNWSNGGAGWSKGPPQKDAEMRVKSVLLYYKTEKISKMEDLGGDCRASDICEV
ncbi:hypothetical protein IAR55_007108 [Kwoniella newhampshirensis]|uniref:GH16 domain-containing protein n=1 Tax=Kwoniella newhampshirensis TaxID=1651941 RepID=A0AAW0YT07_9TREE